MNTMQKIMLDEKLPYGKVLGDDEVSYKQGGYDFNSRKELIPGSKNSAAALISKEIEKIVEEAPPVYEDMHIHALKRHAMLTYAKLEAAGVEFEEVESGKGMQERLIEFLKANA
jgi:hypothetical protein